VKKEYHNLIIYPSTIPADYATFTARASLASTAIHLGRKVGDTIATFWPTSDVSVAPNYASTLIHLKRRNALIPVSSEFIAPSAPDIAAHGIELLSQSYKESTVNGMASRMADTPSHVYMDLIRGQVFSSPQELKMPITGNIARSWEHTSPFLRQWWIHYQKVVERFITQHPSIWFEGNIASQSSQFLPWLPTNILYGTKEQAIAAVFPPGCTLVERTNTYHGPLAGGVLCRFKYTDNSPTGDNLLDITDYLVYPPRGTEGGWSGEAVEIWSFAAFKPEYLVHFWASTGLQVAYSCGNTTTLEYHDEIGGYINRVKWTQVTASSSLLADLADNHRASAFPAYASSTAPLSAANELILQQWLDMLPYTNELAFKIERYLMRRNGVVDKGVGHEGHYLVWLLEQMQHGATGSISDMIQWEDDAIEPNRVRSFNSFCVRIGSTSSIGAPGGAPLNIVDISQNGLLNDLDDREVPVIFTSRDEWDGDEPANPIVSFSAMTGAEIKAVMTTYQQRSDFPAQITQAMIDELGEHGMGAILIPAQAKTAMTFAQSAMYNSVFENEPLNGDTLFVSRDELGEPVSFNVGLQILEDNGFFADTINQMVLLPYEAAVAAPVPVTVTVDVTLDPTWDVGIMTQPQLAINLLARPELVIINGTDAFVAAYQAEIDPILDYRTTAENVLRLFLGIEEMTTSKSQNNDVDLSPLNPAMYRAEHQLKYADGSAEVLRYQVPLKGSYVDMAMLQKDIPKVVRYVYNAVLMPLVSKLDPL
jgi:hypothetical protein